LSCPESITKRINESERLWLFLDYDGTLSEFAPTPEHVQPDPQVIALLSRLVKSPNMRLCMISGRRLSQVKELIPVPGLLLAGTYGIELFTPEGKSIDRLDYQSIRPVLEIIKSIWQGLIGDLPGFYLEDKGWSLALHARFADESKAVKVLESAKLAASRNINTGDFRLLGGHKFMEVCPNIADKGQTVEYILDHYAWQRAFPIYIGDDDKDERAFGVIHRHGGIALLVAAQPRESQADCRLESTHDARAWLEKLPQLIKGSTRLQVANE
jgi:trehalose-phosphatase